MAERIEEPEAEVAESGGAPLSPAGALAIGMRRRRRSTDPKMDAFLDEQTELARLQKEHLHEQRELILSRLRWGRFSDRMKAALQVLTAIVGLAVVGVIAAMAWQAHEDRGVVIEAFSVPPDLAQRGMTGQVVASRLLDRLSDLQARTVTDRPASSYANDWGDDIKVEIPETGVSIGELNRYLRQWLGSQTRISGEVVRTPSGLSVTARAGASAGRTFEGPDENLNGLVQQAAEAIYAQTQPYRYAVYLQSAGQIEAARNAYVRLVRSGSPEDRPWALTGWGSLLQGQGDLRGAAEKGREAISSAPELQVGYPVAYTSELAQSHLEAALRIARQAKSRLHSAPDAFPTDDLIADDLGDFRAELRNSLSLPPTASFEGRPRLLSIQASRALAMTRDHDVSGARAILARLDPATQSQPSPPVVETYCRYAVDDWAGVAALGKLFSSLRRLPLIAYATAMTGRPDEARALVDASPQDCDDCVMARGMVAAAAHDWAAADRWFAEVARRTQSSPFAPTEWGRALLAKGDLDGAIAELKEAHRRGPHYADPLELWGEALMRKGEYAGATAKFAEADKDAPRWGRNHLRWGEALMLSGRYREGRAQYEIANGLDLSVPDRAALNVLLARTASGPLHG
jgi:tetratricopeptide (TPR) repeat protein